MVGPDAARATGGGRSGPASKRPAKRGGDADAPKKRVRWSHEEEEYLREGYDRFKNAMNHWALILQKYPFHRNRTSVDLKDKWRNMNKGK